MATLYTYNGVSLAKFCEQSGVAYHRVVKRIEKLKRNGESYDIGEIINEVINTELRPVYSTYMYKGMTFKEYCDANGLVFKNESLKVTALRKKDEYKDMPLSKIIDIALTPKERSHNSSVCKYYYEGVSVSEYCKSHGLTYTYVIRKINESLKQNPGLTNQEAVNLVISKIGNKSLNPIREYCLNNDLDYEEISKRIAYFKRKGMYTDLATEELIEAARSYKAELPNNIKYYYNGMSLVDYCKENDISYIKIIQRIKDASKRSETKNLSLDEIIKYALEKSDKRNVKYFYKGEPLVDYCKRHNIDVCFIRRNINNLKNNKKYSSYSEEEIIQLALSRQNSVKRDRFFYKGVSLVSYCYTHNLNASHVRSTFYELLNSGEFKNMSQEEILDKAIKKIEGQKRLYYKGVLLKQYCKEHGLSYEIVMYGVNKYRKSKKYKHLSMDQIIELSLDPENIKDRKNALKYKGIPLMKYCARNGLNYKKISGKVKELRKDAKYEMLSDEELIDMIVDGKLKVAIKNEEDYKYSGMPLSEYCKENDINYESVVNTINNFKDAKGYEIYSIEEIIYFSLICKGAVFCKWHYQGRPFNVYCKENDIDYSSVLQRMYALQRDDKYKDISNEELIALALDDKYKVNKHLCDGVTISEYCKKEDVDATLVKIKLTAWKRTAQYRSFNMDELVKEIIKKEKEKINSIKKSNI